MAARPASAAAALAAAALVLTAAAGCGRAAGTGKAAATASPAAHAKVAIPAADRPACAQLLGRLQEVTQAISASSELIANSRDKRQLSRRIATEAKRMRQSAQLMAAGPIPAPLTAADRQLVTALRAFGDDFARAQRPARRGDFQAAVDAMGDKPAVQKIIGASRTIQNACTSGTPAR
ncbi:MAG: hypothetical protein J2P33_24415 [Actinobacteria bacterium]|nr:hypothetical protein [Actinomycetota bacterium]